MAAREQSASTAAVATPPAPQGQCEFTASPSAPCASPTNPSSLAQSPTNASSEPGALSEPPFYRQGNCL